MRLKFNYQYPNIFHTVLLSTITYPEITENIEEASFYGVYINFIQIIGITTPPEVATPILNLVRFEEGEPELITNSTGY